VLNKGAVQRGKDWAIETATNMVAGAVLLAMHSVRVAVFAARIKHARSTTAPFGTGLAGIYTHDYYGKRR